MKYIDKNKKVGDVTLLNLDEFEEMIIQCGYKIKKKFFYKMQTKGEIEDKDSIDEINCIIAIKD